MALQNRFSRQRAPVFRRRHSHQLGVEPLDPSVTVNRAESCSDGRFRYPQRSMADWEVRPKEGFLPPADHRVCPSRARLGSLRLSPSGGFGYSAGRLVIACRRLDRHLGDSQTIAQPTTPPMISRAGPDNSYPFAFIRGLAVKRGCLSPGVSVENGVGEAEDLLL